MNPIRAINQATTKGLNPDGMPSSTRAVDTLIHMAELHKLPDAALQFALAKYNKDKQALAKSAVYLKAIAKDIAKKKGWRFQKESTLNKASNLALLQHVEPYKLGHICWKCNGIGGLPGKPCQTCNGTGNRARPDVLYASMLDISDKVYAETWERRVAVLHTEAGKWDSDLFKEWASRHILEHLQL